MEEFKRISRDLVAKGAIIDYYQDTMQIPNGNIAKWDLIDHKGAAAVVAVREDGKLLMVRQYRNALERETLEIPAGGLNGREVFSNESGLGSAPIAAAAAKTDSCVEQGLVSMTGTFIDTIVICTMTGLAIVLTQSYTTGLDGAAMTTHAFSVGLFIPLIGKYIVNIGLVFFAFTTIIGWNYYGERCMYYLKGLKAVKIYKIVFITFITIGPFMSLEFIFVLADIVNGCMAIPNLIGLIGLRKEIVEETEQYFECDQEIEFITNIEG